MIFYSVIIISILLAMSNILGDITGLAGFFIISPIFKAEESKHFMIFLSLFSIFLFIIPVIVMLTKKQIKYLITYLKFFLPTVVLVMIICSLLNIFGLFKFMLYPISLLSIPIVGIVFYRKKYLSLHIALLTVFAAHLFFFLYALDGLASL